MSLILLDIEGTTTAIDFVTKVLFPYSIERIPSFVEKNIFNPKYKNNFDSLKFKMKKQQISSSCTKNEISKYLQELIKCDVKDSDLKLFQGLIWQEGYHHNELKGHVYPDVPPKLKEWFKNGFKLGVYSSGSIQAQKLLFKNSEYGDLDKYFSYNFDLQIGSKKASDSYTKIAEEVSISPSEITFVSDSTEEVLSALKANFRVYLINREIHTNQNVDLPLIKSFNDLLS